MLGPHATIAHAVHLRDADVDLLAETGTAVAHNPSSNARLAVGIAPLRRLAAHGVTVGIGNDDMAPGDDEDLWSVVRLAHILQRIGDQRDPPLGAADVLGMAWDGGARIAGLDGQAGRIEPGRHGDLALLDLDGLRGVYADPSLPLAELLLGRAARTLVRTVVVGGRVVVDEGRVAGIDREALAGETAEAAAVASRSDPAYRELVERLRPWILRWGSDPAA